MVSVADLKKVATQLRADVLRMTAAAHSGHPSSCASAADIMSVLFFHEMRYDPADADLGDLFVLSKGHAAPLLYAVLKRAGCINEAIERLREADSPLQGHPIPHLSGWVKVATGSLGQGLSVGAGMAYALPDRRIYVLMGDSECSEGSVWEAAQLASHYKLTNLCAIVDINELGQRGKTMLAGDVTAYEKRFASFGWQAISVSGHSIAALEKAFVKARNSKKPCVILAHTIKGKGIYGIEGKEGWHGKVLEGEMLEKALSHLMVSGSLAQVKAQPLPRLEKKRTTLPQCTSYDKNVPIATREAYGNALAAVAHSNPHVIALDAEVSNSTYAEKVKEKNPKQFIECFIAEQNMVSMALGLAVSGYVPCVSTFAAFLTRAHDQIRMAALSKASFVLCGSHAGVSIGEDGASQMGLEDIAMMRSTPGTTILYPSDAISCEKLLHLGVQTEGLVYLRTTRPKTHLLYKQSDEFVVGEFSILRSSTHDSVVLAGAGITTHSALHAADLLLKKGIKAAVVDLYCIKPFNHERFNAFVKQHGKALVVAEDHYSEGGIGEMIRSGLAEDINVRSLAIRHIPHSASAEELLHVHHIDGQAVAAAAQDVCQ